MSLADEIPEQVAYIVVHSARIIPKFIGAQTHIDWMAECLDAQPHSCLVRSSGDQIVSLHMTEHLVASLPLMRAGKLCGF